MLCVCGLQTAFFQHCPVCHFPQKKKNKEVWIKLDGRVLTSHEQGPGFQSQFSNTAEKQRKKKEKDDPQHPHKGQAWVETHLSSQHARNGHRISGASCLARLAELMSSGISKWLPLQIMWGMTEEHSNLCFHACTCIHKCTHPNIYHINKHTQKMEKKMTISMHFPGFNIILNEHIPRLIQLISSNKYYVGYRTHIGPCAQR